MVKQISTLKWKDRDKTEPNICTVTHTQKKVVYVKKL